MELGSQSLQSALSAAAARTAGVSAEARAMVTAAASGLPWSSRIGIASGVAAGMAYLHSRQIPIVHRDLKPGNVLLDSKGTPKAGLLESFFWGFGPAGVYAHLRVLGQSTMCQHVPPRWLISASPY